MDIETATTEIFRRDSARLLASLIGSLRDWDVAEDALQDAYVEALRHWPESGMPHQPSAWLLTTARRKAIDKLRRRANFEDKREQIRHLAATEATADDVDMDEAIADERLRMIFACCHPALPKSARVALTLRTLGGLSTAEIARAFLTTETTMAQRLVRAKQKIKAAGIPYKVPEPDHWAERLDGVLAVVYFVFNEGYSATTGPEPVREDLCVEAIRLAEILHQLAPDEPELLGLLALMRLHYARARTRTDAAGNLVTLEDQDRTRWDKSAIAAGMRALETALALRHPGPYQVQAAISALHAQADSHDSTDWNQIAALYEKLYDYQPTPVVRLNAAVACAFAETIDAGLEMLDDPVLASALGDYQPYHAARADLLRRAGHADAAATAYARAIELSGNDSERAFLERRLHALTRP